MPEVVLDFPRAFVGFTNPDDADEVFRCGLTRLPPEHWESFDEGQASGWTEKDDEGELKTCTFERACILHNSQSFEGGYCCAHHGDTGRPPQLKVR